MVEQLSNLGPWLYGKLGRPVCLKACFSLSAGCNGPFNEGPDCVGDSTSIVNCSEC
jgi:hypothetical protein